MLNLQAMATDARALLAAVITLAVAVVLALVAHAVVFSVLRRWTERVPGKILAASFVRHGRRPARWTLPLLALLLVLPEVSLPAAARSWLQHVSGLGVIAACAWGVILLADILADVAAARYRVDVKDNRQARGIQTQVQVLRRVLIVVVVIVTLAVMLMTFPEVQAIGASVLASAGLAGLVVGMAMKPTLSSLVAGIQIALTQPIRIEDAVTVEGEYGWIEEITSTYVVVRVWDLRRMVLPLTYFIEHPFQNWTRATAADLLGTVTLYLDYSAPVEALRREFERLLEGNPNWKGQVKAFQVTGATEHTLEVRALVDARDSGAAFDLRCQLREGLIAFVQKNYPESLPKTRTVVDGALPRPLAPAPIQG